METVQLAIADVPYASALRELLERSGSQRVRSVAEPDPGFEGVIVLDAQALDRLSRPLSRPERVVLITSNDPQHLSRAWNAGIRSVVFCDDPLNTAVLAIMAAELRLPKECGAESHCASPQTFSGLARGATVEKRTRACADAQVDLEIDPGRQQGKPRERRG